MCMVSGCYTSERRRESVLLSEQVLATLSVNHGGFGNILTLTNCSFICIDYTDDHYISGTTINKSQQNAITQADKRKNLFETKVAQQRAFCIHGATTTALGPTEAAADLGLTELLIWVRQRH